jgi:microsomal dipeptidase-like Zn-dependent dipeptidase
LIADLHSHYAIYLGPRRSDLVRSRALLEDGVAASVVSAVGRFGNRRRWWSRPRVTLESLRAGDCRVVCSVLYCAAQEFDFPAFARRGYGCPGTDGYFAALLRQMDLVEASVAHSAVDVEIARDPAELRAALARGSVALVHCVEGGFHLGGTPAAVEEAAAVLARRGVAYVTLAHLFWRSFAPNVPVMPIVPDRLYRTLFPTPAAGLPDLGKAAIESIVGNGMILDLTHMTEQAMLESIELVGSLAPGRELPVLYSHGAYRFGSAEYSLSAELVEAIARAGGLIGMILSTRLLNDGLPGRPRTIDDSLELLFRHIDRIGELAGSLDAVAVGTDLGGFITPLPGLEDASRLRVLADALSDRYGEVVGRQLCSSNALRFLEAHWSGAARERAAA